MPPAQRTRAARWIRGSELACGGGGGAVRRVLETDMFLYREKRRTGSSDRYLDDGERERERSLSLTKRRHSAHAFYVRRQRCIRGEDHASLDAKRNGPRYLCPVRHLFDLRPALCLALKIMIVRLVMCEGMSP